MSKYKIIVSNEYLAHYSSPYYDPVKAHEYYMQHRKLKGTRPSTAGLNQTGHEANEYVRKRISEERARVVNKHAKESTQKAKTYADQAKNQIKALSKRIAQMSPEEKKYRAGVIREAVSRIRERNNAQRAKLAEAHSKFASQTTQKYEKKYETELNKIVGDSGFQKARKRQRR